MPVTSGPKHAIRIWVLLARESPVGVVFRRGPRHHVQMLKWNRRDDTFEPGQWFKGQVDLGLSDLSPDGRLLIYFALKYRGPYQSWTAISKPPWFTALAFLPTLAVYGGGGEFKSNRLVWLLHSRDDAPMIEPKLRPLKVAGYKEDRPLEAQSQRLHIRDGWTVVRHGRFLPSRPGLLEWKLRRFTTWQKTNPKGRLALEIDANHFTGGFGKGPWNYRILSDQAGILTEMQADWADWDSDGSLLFAQHGRLFRAKRRRGRLAAPKELVNMSGNRFEEKAPPLDATRW